MGKRRSSEGAAIGEPAPMSEALSAAITAVRRDGAIARSALVRMGVPRKRLDEALAALAREGLEVTPKAVRLPVRDQLHARLADGALVPIKAAAKSVSGASKAEVDRAITGLLAAREARLIVRTSEIVLGSAEANALPDADLERLARTLDALTKTIKLARKKSAGLLRADVAQALAPFAASARPLDAPPPDEHAADDLRALVDRHREETGLTYVPAIVRALGGRGARDSVHRALLRGARSGVFELRPESGLGRLSAEDAELCVPGPLGSRLSWVRRVDS